MPVSRSFVLYERDKFYHNTDAKPSPNYMDAQRSSPAAMMDGHFSFKDADLILRSDDGDGDGVEFAVHSQILYLISPVLVAKLSRAMKPGSTGRLVAQMDEDTRSLRLLLQSCYPRPACGNEPELLSILDIKCAASLAERYHLDFLREMAQKALISYDEPALAFAVAWRYGYGETARAAARQSLEIPDFFRSIVRAGDRLEFNEVPATALFHLYRYRCEAQSQLQRVLRNSAEHPVTWITPFSIEAQLLVETEPDVQSTCSCISAVVWFRVNGAQAAHQWRVYSWWWGYVCSVIHSLCNESESRGLEETLDDTLLSYMRSSLHCTGCNSGILATQVLKHTRRNLRREVEERLRTIPLPIGIVHDHEK